MSAEGRTQAGEVADSWHEPEWRIVGDPFPPGHFRICRRCEVRQGCRA
jgi:hypothetical protein